MPIASEALKEEWKCKLEKWHASGLKGSAWCHKNNIAHHVFLYWRRKLEGQLAKNKTKKAPLNFVELSDKAQDGVGFTIEIQGISFHLSKAFDEAIFLKSINLLRRLSC